MAILREMNVKIPNYAVQRLQESRLVGSRLALIFLFLKSFHSYMKFNDVNYEFEEQIWTGKSFNLR